MIQERKPVYEMQKLSELRELHITDSKIHDLIETPTWFKDTNHTKTTADMHAQLWGTLLSLAKLHFNVLNVVGHPLWLLLPLYQLSAKLSAALHLQETADKRTTPSKFFVFKQDVESIQ